MNSSDINQLRAELIGSGFMPTRFGLFVRKIRRVLWPLIRPFHFFQLEKMIQAENRIDYIEDRLNKLFDDLPAIVYSHAEIRSEVSAVVNRHVSIEEDFYKFGNKLKELEVLFQSDVTAVTNRYQNLQESVANCDTSLLHLKDRLAAEDAELHQIAKKAREVDEKISVLDGRNKLILANTDGGLFVLKHGEFISDQVASGKIWDSHIVDVIKQAAVLRNGLAIDVGAHFGMISTQMARYFRQVVSFEPNDFNFRILTANVALNGLRNVDCINSALFSESETLSLGRSDQQEIPLPTDGTGKFDGLSASNLGAYLFTKDGSGIFLTQSRTLDSYEFQDVAFIKIDVQGADGEVILGALKTIERCKPIIVFEWEEHLSEQFSVPFKNVEEILKGMRYSIAILKKHNEKQVDFIASPDFE